MNKSHFAKEYDCCFFGNAPLSKLLISFECVTENGKWNGKETKPSKDSVQAFRKLRKMKYTLYLEDVPQEQQVLDWLDQTFDYDFTCNDCPTRYADLCDHWTTISPRIETRLLSEGDSNSNRDINYSNNWLEICRIIKENDILARTKSSYIIFDDTDMKQQKEKNGIVDEKGTQLIGSSYIPVEKMNEETTEFLKKIAEPQTDTPVTYAYKPNNERWNANVLVWKVKEEIAEKYGVQFVIEQGSLYYRGTWLKVIAKKLDAHSQDLGKIAEQFCRDFNIDSRRELSFITPYDLPWPEGQKQREKEDDRTDDFFDSYDED